MGRCLWVWSCALVGISVKDDQSGWFRSPSNGGVRKRQRGITLSGSCFHTVVSGELTRNMKCINWYSRCLCSFCQAARLSKPQSPVYMHPTLTVVPRMTKSVHVAGVCVCLGMFLCTLLLVCMPLWLHVFSCECVSVLRPLGSECTGGSSRLQELLTAARSPDSQPLIKHWHKNTATVCVWTVMKRRRLQRHTRCNLAQHELSVRVCVCVCVLSICVCSLMRHICPQRCPLRYWGIHQV